MNSKRLFIYHLIMNFIPATRLFKFKAMLLRWCGATIGANVRVTSSVKFYTSGSLEIGDNTWLGHEVLITGGNALISIGKNCDIAPRVSIISGTHKINKTHDIKIAGEGYSLPIKIGDGCWLCANSLVLGGSLVDSKSIITPNAVVREKYNGSLIIGGNPSKAIRVLI